MKKEFISKFDIHHKEMDISNPLTVGNGNFAFTCDVTGVQTLYEAYRRIPLCTMSNFIWAQRNTEGQIPYQEYARAQDGAPIRYMTDTESKDYDKFRDDVFKFDLFKLVFLYKNERLKQEQIEVVSQQLSLYDGILISKFKIEGILVEVETKIPQNHNNLQIKIQTKLKDLALKIIFFEPASTMEGRTEKQSSYEVEQNVFFIKSELASYALYFKTNLPREDSVFYTKDKAYLIFSFHQDFEDDNAMHDYFSKAKSLDTGDEELNRRLVLSLYLLKVNTLGIYPPAETGLTCNSWYGKFHLEMHLWHHLGLIRMGLYEYVLPSLLWYLTLYESSKERAEFQGYQGIRLPKMTDYRGQDTPSNIGCLLIWQMPHIIIMLDEILYQNPKALDIERFIPLVKGLIDFMSSFYYKKNGYYHLDTPLIPANENVEYDKDTPIFEECYTIHAFQIFKQWIKEYELEYDTNRIEDILKDYVPLPVYQNCYEAFQGCEETYSKYPHDHPMMIGMYSFFKSTIVDESIIQHTLNKILNAWTLDDTWGWDFPMLAMSAYHIGDKDLALQILKMKALKNGYIKNGHNPQLPKQDLPIYLPGNGAYILALSHIFEEEFK